MNATNTVTSIQPVTLYPASDGDGDSDSVLGRIEVERTDQDEIRLQTYSMSEGAWNDAGTVYLNIPQASKLMAALGKEIMA